MTSDPVSTDPVSPPARITHRIAVLAVCLVWPLIWVGGLVTTYDAGMAVPDWPGTYGYNLFQYPYQTWLFGPFDLFIEHGHRLLGAIVGFVAIGLVVAAMLQEHRIWVIGLTIAVLVAVIGQGVLGGLRVVLGDRTLAMVHGCTGPLFFSLCVAAAVVTSRWWWLAAERPPARDGRLQTPSRMLVGLSLGLIVISFAQLVLGAQLRHIQPTATPTGFVHTVAMHVTTALVIWVLAAWVGWQLHRCGDLTLSFPGLLLLGLITIQIVLGLGTWVVNYGFPSFMQQTPGAAEFLVRAKGFGDAIVVTAHVATGSLILAISTLVWLRTFRLHQLSSRLSSAVSQHGLGTQLTLPSEPRI